MKIGSGTLTVKNAKGQQITVIDNKGNTTSKIYGASTPTTTSITLTVTNSTKSPVTVSSAIKTINASTRTSAVKITGNSLSSTIYGGKGNDTLKGGNGADVFIYKSGEGNDVITEYTASDKNSIAGGTYTRSTVGNDVRIKVGSGSILLKNAKAKIVTINNSKKIEERWFMEGDNNYNLSSSIHNLNADLDKIFTNKSDSDIMSKSNNFNEEIFANERWDRHWLDDNQVSSHGRERSNRL